MDGVKAKPIVYGLNGYYMSKILAVVGVLRVIIISIIIRGYCYLLQYLFSSRGEVLC